MDAGRHDAGLVVDITREGVFVKVTIEDHDSLTT